jgi:hypothetical protein
MIPAIPSVRAIVADVIKSYQGFELVGGCDAKEAHNTDGASNMCGWLLLIQARWITKGKTIDECLTVSPTSKEVRLELCDLIRSLLLVREGLADGNECLQCALQWLIDTTDMGLVMPVECQCTLTVIAAFQELPQEVRGFNLTVLQGDDYKSLAIAVSTCGVMDNKRLSVAEAQRVFSAPLGGFVGSHFFLLKEATSDAMKWHGTDMGERLVDAFVNGGLAKPALGLTAEDMQAARDPAPVMLEVVRRSTEDFFFFF